MHRELRQDINLIESKSQQQLRLNPLPYARTDLEPVLSQESLDYHYGHLARGYVDRYNRGQGDSDFNEAGAYLHNLFFPQLRAPQGANRPQGAVLSLIEREHGSYDQFRERVESEAMGIQGSGWVYMSRSGEIKTIANHAIRRDIALLIDWWEHAWVLDYQHDKKKYLKNLWRIMDWNVINNRL